MIALCLALHAVEPTPSDSLVEGVDVAWVREEALSWWGEGFREDSSYEGFQTILEEMIGLGVLRKVGNNRYALRSANLLNLLGNRTEIEQKLLDASEKQPPPPYEAGAFRRTFRDDVWCRSPLTYLQESQLLAPSSGVSVVFGTEISGLGNVEPFLKVASSQAEIICLANLCSYGEFVKTVEKRAKDRREGLVVLLVPSSCPWTERWVWEASAILDRKTSRKRFTRVIFLADARTAWQYTTVEKRPPVTEHSLKPWSESALRRWMIDAGVAPGDPQAAQYITQITGNWPKLVHELGDRSRSTPHKWRDHLEALDKELVTDSKWYDAFGIVPDALEALKILAQLDDPASIGDLITLASAISAEQVSRVIRWADRLSIVSVGSQAKYALDPVVARLLHAQS